MSDTNFAVTVEKDTLVIRLKINPDRTPSSTGKTLAVASTGGNKKTGVTDPATGKEIVVGVNAYVSAS